MSSENIIFLDIDGVLNTMHHLRRQKKETGKMSSNNWCPIACKHVTLLCEQFDAGIVISSTWRYNHSAEERNSSWLKMRSIRISCWG
ncbi:MAG: HAD domain-containing protein [Balneolaceae bacterium]|nr:HAD domain-containing protein [Balneolaceae bacterium]